MNHAGGIGDGHKDSLRGSPLAHPLSFQLKNGTARFKLRLHPAVSSLRFLS